MQVTDPNAKLGAPGVGEPVNVNYEPPVGTVEEGGGLGEAGTPVLTEDLQKKAAEVEEARTGLGSVPATPAELSSPVAEGEAEVSPPAGETPAVGADQGVGDALKGTPNSHAGLEDVLKPRPPVPAVGVLPPSAEGAPAPVAPPMPPPLEVDESSTDYDAATEEAPAPAAPIARVAPQVTEPLGAETVEAEPEELTNARQMLKEAQENFAAVSKQFSATRNSGDNSPARFLAFRDAAAEVGRWELVIKSLERSSLERKPSDNSNPNENGSNGVAA